MDDKDKKPNPVIARLMGADIGDGPDTILLDGVRRRIADLNPAELERARRQKYERIGNHTLINAGVRAATAETEKLEAGRRKSAETRADRAGTPGEREEFRNAAREEWEREGQEGAKRSTKERMAEYLLTLEKQKQQRDERFIQPKLSTATGWLKKIGIPAYRRGQAKRRK